MARLLSDLLDGGGRRYFFGLNATPGFISNSAPATLTINGLAATIQELTDAFRTPATAALQVQGKLGVIQTILLPTAAPLAYQGKIPALLTQIVVTNALPPDYTDLAEHAPTIVYIATVTPDRALLSVASLEHNITPGGNIGFISPQVGSLSLQGRAANFPREAAAGGLVVAGLAPTLSTEVIVTPEAGSVSLSGLLARLAVPFVWIDDRPVSPSLWNDDPRA